METEGSLEKTKQILGTTIIGYRYLNEYYFGAYIYISNSFIQNAFFNLSYQIGKAKKTDFSCNFKKRKVAVKVTSLGLSMKPFFCFGFNFVGLMIIGLNMLFCLVL
jgi:hypothetical protein